MHRNARLPDDVERLALLGWHLYPASPRTRAGKFRGAQAAATTDLDQLGAWAAQYPDCNWRAVCGPSRIFCLDVDVPGADHVNDGPATLKALIAKHGALPERPMVRSGGGGWLLIFRHDGEALLGRSGMPGPGLDPLRGPQTCTVPPSIHHRTGTAYRWIIPPWELSPPPAAPWLVQLLTPPPPPPPPIWLQRGLRPDDDRITAKLNAAVSRVLNAKQGGRNNALNKEAYGLARWVAAGLITEGEAVARLYGAGRSIGMEDRRVRNIIQSAFKAGYAKPIELSR